jgi:methionyl-tRNA formyltransferase
MAESWRVCMICTIRPISHVLAGALREQGHEPVALVAPRPPAGADEPPEPLRLTPSSAPAGVDLLFARDKLSIERLLHAYEPDLTVCWGFPWKLPQGALDVARLGSINQHPALLPRHRGPIPFAWTLRSGDTDWGFTWHRMDAELDTGNILAQGSTPVRDDDCNIAEFGPRLLEQAVALLPQALERVATGDPGDLQPEEGATWAGHFEDDDYVRIDWSEPARRIHDQVRAWHLTFGHSNLRAPVAALDGEEFVVLQTRLSDPGGSARRVECGDGPIWVVASEPV